MSQTSDRVVLDAAAGALGDSELLGRIAAEFHEMPGLQLTLAQAARLFNLEARSCERVLNVLVDERRLHTDGQVFALMPSERRFRRCA